MSDELVERLLDWPYQGETMAHDAAERIVALTAERDANGKDYCALMERYDALVVNNARLESTLKDRAFILEERDRTFALMLARAETAEAERDGYRKALEDIIKDYEPGYPLSHDVIKYVARAALEGESHE